MSEKNLHITVAAVPNTQTGNPKLLEHELQLAKASILYADHVELCSMSAWMTLSFQNIGNASMNVAQTFDMLMNFAPAISALDPNAINLPEMQKIQRLLKRNPALLTKKERIILSRFKEGFPGLWENLRRTFDEGLKDFGFDEIDLATKKGLLEIHPFPNVGVAELAQEYFAAVQNILTSSHTHPMLDEQTNDLISFALKEGLMSVRDITTRKTKQTGLVADLFERLPVFDIKMDELIDLRDELRNPLVRFRAEMVTLSKDIQSVAWDKDFPSDVQQTYQSKVEPAIVEIEEKLKSNSFKEFWSRRLVDKYGFLAGGTGVSYALGAAISPLAGIGAALLSASLFAKAGQAELNEKINEIERNGLYFYYRMKKHK